MADQNSKGALVMKIILCFLLLAIPIHVDRATNEGPEPFRIVPIQPREHGYSTFESIAIRSESELDAFLKDTAKKIGWNHRQVFEDALLNAKVDFSKEALVLLRHTEGSGSVKVDFETPVLKGRNLLCEIKGRPIPDGFGGTGDMAYYCFAVVVSKEQVNQVELQAIEGGFKARRLKPIALQISEK